MKNTAISLINCPDRKGIVLAIASFLYEHGANILHSDQHQDNELGLFFMRVEWALKDFDLNRANFREKFTPLASQFSMTWQVEYCDRTPIIAVFVLPVAHPFQTGEEQRQAAKDHESDCGSGEPFDRVTVEIINPGGDCSEQKHNAEQTGGN